MAITIFPILKITITITIIHFVCCRLLIVRNMSFVLTKEEGGIDETFVIFNRLRDFSIFLFLLFIFQIIYFDKDKKCVQYKIRETKKVI